MTRVVYVEDPKAALPVQATGEQSWFEVAPGMDPLVVADSLGRPIAIVRLGGRVPEREPDAAFLFGCPPVMKLPPRPAAAPAPAPAGSKAAPQAQPAKPAPTTPTTKSGPEASAR